ncbi:hypothetical protein J3Q64DRAFT_1756366 [Phycomyces blakesleeanus]|uniref:Uncharacterized protein n=2 Tax=Phycomyces blakesleeanus TaxID=4837 RepID=A0A163DK63_PHYB8|nr:hypothetical protein PHYBLDRAFT_73505 [Phycomyces blakesleeanus NRRL 1555(-)]OAD71850.1 hypothetical protein PHYBLDRAFT_73505 [Phycomyces blakesleeanus NRRL 1555(-)]|eukprot:XP_018289890.1 hypothetical protein PHYBLDRAFT_73505 [Phycomyces blakesleeanus NRRL 1555(-)]
MSDLNWCTYCDKSVSSLSDSLYCSQECLRSDALNHHPLLGYDYAEFKDFPRSSPSPGLSPSSTSSSASTPPLSPVPSYTLPSPHIHQSQSQTKIQTQNLIHSLSKKQIIEDRLGRLSPPLFDLGPCKQTLIYTKSSSTSSSALSSSYSSSSSSSSAVSLLSSSSTTKATKLVAPTAVRGQGLYNAPKRSIFF